MSDADVNSGVVRPFSADPLKMAQPVTRGDLADLIGTIGLTLSTLATATACVLNSNSDSALVEIQATLQHLRRLAEECRMFVGQEDDVHGG